MIFALYFSLFTPLNFEPKFSFFVFIIQNNEENFDRRQKISDTIFGRFAAKMCIMSIIKI